MESKLKVTDIPDECSFYDLVAGDNVLEIPLFQRPYMWKSSHYKTLIDDIKSVEEDPGSAIFLGVIVSYSRGSGPGRPPTWMIVDGQQRVTTLYLCVMAAVYVAAINNEFDWASDMIGRYLLVRPMAGLSHNTKLIPSFNDRAQFAKIWEDIIKIRELSNHSMYAYNPPRPPAPGGECSGNMINQFNNIRKDLSKIFKDYGIDGLTSRIDIIVTKLSVVSISLREPTVAPKIFERLNYGAEPITVADLVRNEIFARSGDDLDAAKSLFSGRWEPFIARFGGSNNDFNKFLFPYGLVRNPNIKRNDLFINIRSVWDGLGDPGKIIDDLEIYQEPYLALSEGGEIIGASKLVMERVDRLFRLNIPSSIYPFLMPAIISYKNGNLRECALVGLLDLIESFLFRRAVSGIEPTGLHAVFKGMWRDLVGDNDDISDYLTKEKIKRAILSRTTVSWPNDEEFMNSIISGPLYRRKVAGYAIREYEVSLDDECPIDLSEIEHIAPQSMNNGWKVDIPENYEKIIHTWGNLVPISREMNPGVSSKSFKEKREYYLKSRYSSVRRLASLEVWRTEDIKNRSKEIAEWAICRWPD